VAEDERGRFAAEMAAHHWLGSRLSGRMMRYVATVDGEWVALAGFGSAALRVPVREEYLGWDEATRSRRLGLVAASQRLCVLPAGRRPGLACAPLVRPATARTGPAVDLNTVPVDGAGGLCEALAVLGQ
jgi:hypothetical protein